MNAGFWELVGGALRLNETAYALVASLPDRARLALFIVLLAGLSEAAAQSVVLFINRVKPTRFLLSLVISALLFAFTYGFWTYSIWLVARFVFGSGVSPGTVAAVVALGYAPRLLGFLAFMPLVGVPLQYVLTVWSLLTVLVGLRATLGLPLSQVLLCTLLGSLLLLGLQRTVGRPVMALARWLRRRAAGVDLVMDRQGLRELLDAGPEVGLWSVPESSKRKV